MGLHGVSGTGRALGSERRIKLDKAEELKTFSDVIRYQGRVNPERICIQDIKSQRSYSYKDFDCLVDKTVDFLHSHGVKGGDRITAVIENSPEYCFFYFATLRMGRFSIPCHSSPTRKR